VELVKENPDVTGWFAVSLRLAFAFLGNVKPQPRLA
jgi:hypothetical protein